MSEASRRLVLSRRARFVAAALAAAGAAIADSSRGGADPRRDAGREGGASSTSGADAAIAATDAGGAHVEGGAPVRCPQPRSYRAEEPPPIAQASAQVQVERRARLAEATRYLHDGGFEQASALLDAAYRLHPGRTTLLALAKALADAGRPNDALAAVDELRRRAPPSEQEAASALRESILAKLASVRVVLRSDDEPMVGETAIQVDGAPCPAAEGTFHVDPGRHRVSASVHGAVVGEAEVQAASGSVVDVTLRVSAPRVCLSPPPPPPPAGCRCDVPGRPTRRLL